MTTITVERSQNVDDVELLFTQLMAEPEPSGLLLPTQLKNAQIGGVAALIQFIITWAKRSKNGALLTHIQALADAADQLTNLSQEDHGLVAILMAKDIRNKKGTVSIRPAAYRAAKTRISTMELGVEQARQGPQLLLVCADHTTRAKLPAFYYQLDSQEHALKSRRDFAAFAENALIALTSRMLPARLPRKVFADLGVILHELFQNTDEWAKTDWNEQRIARSTRGIRFEVVTRTPDALLQAVRGSSPLERYISHAPHRQDEGSQSVLEISVFDSGPGLAQRWLKRAISQSEAPDIEYAAAMHCLRKHATSSVLTNKGLGLHRVMEALTDTLGFLRIRSGRLSLYRDFIRDPYIATETVRNSFMLDWATENRDRPTLCASAEGTLLTLLIPLTFGKVSG